MNPEAASGVEGSATGRSRPTSADADGIAARQRGAAPSSRRDGSWFAGVASMPRRTRDGVFPALRHQQYARLWAANTGSLLAYGMSTVAQGWLAIELTNSPFALGVLGVFMSIPMLVLSPIGGLLADRLDRRKLLLSTQVIMGITTLAIAILAATGLINMVHLAMSAFIMGSIFGVNMPARSALMSQLVPREDLANAVGIHSSTMNASRIVGPALAGGLIGLIGIAGTYFAQVLGYVWSTALLTRLQPPESRGRANGAVVSDLRAGFAYVIRNRPVLGMMVLALAPAVFTMPSTMLLPAFVKHDLAAGPQLLGILMSALGVGGLAGSLVVVVFSRLERKGRALVGGALAYGLLIIVLGLTRSVWAAAFVLAAAGFCSAIYMATNQTILQLVVPNHLRGRVMSIWMLSWGLMPLGLLPLSAVAESLGVPVSMYIGGGLGALTAILVLLWRTELWSMVPEAAPLEA